MQKVRRMASDKKVKINEEVKRLAVNFIKPVIYHEWVSNIVDVPKKNGKIRVCINLHQSQQSVSDAPLFVATNL